MRVKSLHEIWFKRMQPVLREIMVTEKVIGHEGSKRIFAFMGNLFRLSRIPLVRDRFPWIDPKKSNISWLPVNSDIEGAGAIALPIAVMDRLIELASCRVIVSFCPCRRIEKDMARFLVSFL